ncbi:MAG TPA: hypothetical protein PLJ88_00295 [Agitococcus sp.]|nr:hypothetical protein [Agitococcus sp.]
MNIPLMHHSLKIIAGLLFLNASCAYAQYDLYVGLGGLNYRLLEHDLYSNKQLVKESGILPSINYGLNYQFHPKFLLHIQAQQSYGVVDYDGQTQTGIPHQSDSTHLVSQGAASIGYLFLEQSELYIGLHGQQDLRDVANRNGVYGATEIYTKLFSKIGLKQVVKFNTAHSLSLFAESYQPFFAESYVDSRVSDDVTLSLKKGSAKAWGVKYLYQYSPTKGLFLDYRDFSARYQQSSQASQTFYGQATGKFLYQPPIQFKQHTLAAGLTWYFD